MSKAKRLKRKQQERKEQNRRRQERGRGTQARDWWGEPPPRPPSVEEFLMAAAEAGLHGDETAMGSCIDELASRGGADGVMVAFLHVVLHEAWQGGWMPADIVRYVGRELGKRHVRMVIDGIAGEMRRYSAATVDDRWQAQLDAMDARVWWADDAKQLSFWQEREGLDRRGTVENLVEVVTRLMYLPPLERICPIPGQGRRNTAARVANQVDEKTLNRVRGLLAKAESTEFPAEAETFTSAAQSLMSRHSIDAAMLAADTGRQDKPEARRVGIDAPYELPKASLLSAVAEANRCRAVWTKELGFSTLLGFVEDMEAVELLFTSLLIQATTAMTQAGKKEDRYGRSRTRSFRQSFLASYAHRIGERLAEASADAVRDATSRAGEDLLPVLAARNEEVREAAEAMFPNLRLSSAASVTDREGWYAGQAAADLAKLHGNTEVRS